MTSDGGGPATAAGLRAELTAVLRRARDSGVDVRGGWECDGGGAAGWDVVVTELRTGSDDRRRLRATPRGGLRRVSCRGVGVSDGRGEQRLEELPLGLAEVLVERRRRDVE